MAIFWEIVLELKIRRKKNKNDYINIGSETLSFLSVDHVYFKKNISLEVDIG